MLQAVKSNLLLYADDSRLVCQHKNIAEIKKTLNGDFENISNIFVIIKLNQFYSQVSEGLKIFLN